MGSPQLRSEGTRQWRCLEDQENERPAVVEEIAVVLFLPHVVPGLDPRLGAFREPAHQVRLLVADLLQHERLQCWVEHVVELRLQGLGLESELESESVSELAL